MRVALRCRVFLLCLLLAGASHARAAPGNSTCKPTVTGELRVHTPAGLREVHSAEVSVRPQAPQGGG